MANRDYKAMAKEIYKWCLAHEAWDDCTIYFNGKAWSNKESWAYKGEEFGHKIDVNLYEYKNKNPRTYFEYGNPNTLSISTEGRLYEILNYYWEYDFMTEWYEDFIRMFDKYDGYIEFGNSWNFTFIED